MVMEGLRAARVGLSAARELVMEESAQELDVRNYVLNIGEAHRSRMESELPRRIVEAPALDTPLRIRERLYRTI
jgi:hypothetical protein